MTCYLYYLIIVHKDPDHLFDSIRGKGLTIKETSAPDYFLGVDFEHVKELKINNNILKLGSKTYLKHMMNNCKNTLGSEPSRKHAVIPPDYNP